MLKVEYYSHRGGYNGTTRVRGYRAENQDTICLLSLSVGGGSGDILVAIMCDGMGGGLDGKYASSYICSVIQPTLESIDVPAEYDLRFIQSVIYKTLLKANDDIVHKYGASGVSATTCTVLVTDGSDYCYLHVGDTRLYDITEGMEQITVDDTYVGELVRLGKLTVEEARVHPKRHRITKALGVAGVDIYLSKLCSYKDNGIMLLTSDGFSEFLTDEKVSLLRSSEGSLELLADMMVEEGQRDNISAILIRKEDDK